MSVLEYRSSTDDRAGGLRIVSTLGWAVYLGMSWTWCIGMFLPVLLVRDYGFWAWVVFAIPNVVGAAAMGWVLRDGTSQIIAAEHLPAITTFSAITATFQIFFLGWVFGSHENRAWLAATIVFAILVVTAIRTSDWRRKFIAFLVFLGSAAMIVLGSGQLRFPGAAIPTTDREILPIAALAPVCTFGFLLCPYLDASFHMSRQRMRGLESRVAFSLGFGAAFFAMIIFSLLYAIPVEWMLKWGWRKEYLFLRIHWMLQLAFTIALHWNSDDAIGQKKSPLAYWMAVGTCLAGSTLAAFASSKPLYGKLDPSEVVYRCFMGFYGLIFPAYVWLCMIPGRGRAAPTRWQWGVLAVSVSLAAPFYWMGFIERKMVWVLPGLAIVLLARVLVSRNAPTPSPCTQGEGRGEGSLG